MSEATDQQQAPTAAPPAHVPAPATPSPGPPRWWEPHRIIGPEIIKAMRDGRNRLKDIGASGHNKHDNYKFSNAEDFSNAIEEALAKTGLVVVVEVATPKFYDTQREKMRSGCHVLIQGHLYHDSGQSLPFQFMGEAFDRADKASYKATTGAREYALCCLFDLKGGTDPESDERVSQAADESDPPNPYRQEQQQRRQSTSRQSSGKQSGGRGSRAASSTAPQGEATQQPKPGPPSGERRPDNTVLQWQKAFISCKSTNDYAEGLQKLTDSGLLQKDIAAFTSIFTFAGQHLDARCKKGEWRVDAPDVEALYDRLRSMGDTMDHVNQGKDLFDNDGNKNIEPNAADAAAD